jgi:hypothetical protein
VTREGEFVGGLSGKSSILNDIGVAEIQEGIVHFPLVFPTFAISFIVAFLQERLFRCGPSYSKNVKCSCLSTKNISSPCALAGGRRGLGLLYNAALD